MNQNLELTQALQNIPGESVFVQSIREEAATNLDGVVQMIKDQAGDPGSRLLLIDVIGETTVLMIESL